MKTALENVGMKKQVDKFVLSLNRAAEEASKEAAPILINAIKGITLTDAVNILKGSDNAATKYLNTATNNQLKAQFKPIVQRAIQKVEVTKYWNPLVTKYNRIPGAQKMNPDLEEYVTIKAIEGLFKLIAEEELKIRKDPAARTSDLLRKIFG
jgi:enolase